MLAMTLLKLSRINRLLTTLNNKVCSSLLFLLQLIEVLLVLSCFCTRLIENIALRQREILCSLC